MLVLGVQPMRLRMSLYQERPLRQLLLPPPLLSVLLPLLLLLTTTTTSTIRYYLLLTPLPYAEEAGGLGGEHLPERHSK